MIFYIFGETYFLALKNTHGHIVGHTPQQLVAHLRTKYVTATQKRNEIYILDAKLRLSFSTDNIIEEYFSEMIICRYQLAQLGQTITAEEIIRLCYIQFQKQADFTDGCEKWNDIAPLLLTWSYFQSFFIKEVIKLENRRRTLGSTNIANVVEEST